MTLQTLQAAEAEFKRLREAAARPEPGAYWTEYPSLSDYITVKAVWRNDQMAWHAALPRILETLSAALSELAAVSAQLTQLESALAASCDEARSDNMACPLAAIKGKEQP